MIKFEGQRGASKALNLIKCCVVIKRDSVKIHLLSREVGVGGTMPTHERRFTFDGRPIFLVRTSDIVQVSMINETNFLAFRSVKRRVDFVDSKTFKISTRFVSNVSTRERFLKIQNSRQLTRACCTRVALIVAMNGCDRWKSATIRSSSSKVTRDLTFNKENLGIAGCWQLPRISLKTTNFSSESFAMTTASKTCTREFSTFGEFPIESAAPE